MANEPEHESPEHGGKVGSGLGKKLGPFPLWQWGLIAGVPIGLLFYLKSKGGGSSAKLAVAQPVPSGSASGGGYGYGPPSGNITDTSSVFDSVIKSIRESNDSNQAATNNALGDLSSKLGALSQSILQQHTNNPSPPVSMPIPPITYLPPIPPAINTPYNPGVGLSYPIASPVGAMYLSPPPPLPVSINQWTSQTGPSTFITANPGSLPAGMYSPFGGSYGGYQGYNQTQSLQAMPGGNRVTIFNGNGTVIRGVYGAGT